MPSVLARPLLTGSVRDEVEMLLVWVRGPDERNIYICLYRVLLTIIDTWLVKDMETKVGHIHIITYS